MDQSQTPFTELQRPKKPKSGLSTLELVIWSTATIVISLFIFGAIAAIPFAPRLANIFSPSHTPSATPNRLPTALPIQTVAGIAATETPVTPSPAPQSTEAPALNPTQTALASSTDTASAVPTATTQQVAATGASTATASAPSFTPTVTRTPAPSATPPPGSTPAPTATRTPTVTRPPVITPTSTATVPTALPEGWTIEHVRLHSDTFANSLLVYGEAVNNTGSTQQIDRITGTFYDGQGQQIAGPDDVDEFLPVDIVPQDGRVPFELTIDEIADAATYTLEVRSQPNSDTPHTDFQFTVQSQYTEFGEYCLAATVQNMGPELGEYLTIVAVLFDSQGNVISLSGTYEPQLELVADGLPHEFDICADPLEQTVAQHDLRGWGR